ncbi:MAG: 2-oxo acid dehydrogenase subunit E2 [Pseudonocardia sp.]|nr:2-oxo acid dehydrogenase subunit E2 [Pseudonocardia sp.]
MRQTFALPDVGEGLTEAEILAWQVSVGDTVSVNQIIVEIETAKAAVELPSPYAGTVAELFASPGQTVAVGTPIIVISTGVEGDPERSDPAPPTAEAGAEPTAQPHDTAEGGTKIGEVGPDGRIATLVGYVSGSGTVVRRRRVHRAGPLTAPPPPTPPTVPAAESPVRDAVPLAKPPVRKLAKELGVDLRALAGSGPRGAITRDDVHASARSAAVGGTTGQRRVPVRSLRKATAAAMVSSAFTAPHVTEFLAVDVTPMMELRERLRTTREFREVKLSPLVFTAKAVCLAIRRTPEVNASWRDGSAGEDAEIVFYDRVQLGIAAATPRGLIVPKIRDADTLSLRELAEALGELTATARAGITPPADLVGGTFTITNVGVFGVDTGTPILNPGESAILALGAVKPAPWVVDGQLAVRTVCQLALSFDHRVVDGEQGSRFLADVAALLADPGLALSY